MTAAVLAAALVAALAGCSSGSGGGSKQLDALRELPANAQTLKQVTYVDEVRVRELGKADAKRFILVGQPASTLLNGYGGAPWGDALKQTQIDTAVDAGTLGHWSGDFDAAVVTAALKKQGFTVKEKDGAQVLTSDSGSLSLVVSDSELRYSAADGPFSPGRPGKGDSLADREQYRQAADCLGDVYHADFTALSPEKPVTLSVLGQQADDSGKNTEVLCAVTKDRATADRLAAKLTALVKAKPEKYGAAEVAVGKGGHPVVRTTVPDTSAQRPGRLYSTEFDLWMALGDA